MKTSYGTQSNPPHSSLNANRRAEPFLLNSGNWTHHTHALGSSSFHLQTPNSKTPVVVTQGSVRLLLLREQEASSIRTLWLAGKGRWPEDTEGKGEDSWSQARIHHASLNILVLPWAPFCPSCHLLLERKTRRDLHFLGNAWKPLGLEVSVSCQMRT